MKKIGLQQPPGSADPTRLPPPPSLESQQVSKSGGEGGGDWKGTGEQKRRNLRVDVSCPCGERKDLWGGGVWNNQVSANNQWSPLWNQRRFESAGEANLTGFEFTGQHQRRVGSRLLPESEKVFISTIGFFLLSPLRVNVPPPQAGRVGQVGYRWDLPPGCNCPFLVDFQVKQV